MPAAVAATAAAIAVESTAAVAPPSRSSAANHGTGGSTLASPARSLNRMTRSTLATTIAGSWTIWPQPPTTAAARWAWGVGALVLALLLAAQLTHHYRLQLARNATVGPALREVYSSLGMPLPPNWNLAAFELRQWGANESAPSAAGAMTVRASLKNGAAFAQPMPLLRLELEDRFGGTVARRDFQPAEYLKDPAQATRLLPAGASTEAELAIVGATSEAVGYRLDVCLRDENGVVRCAEPVAAAPPSEPGATVSAPTAAGARAMARAAPHRHRTLPARGPRAARANGRRDGPALPPALSPAGRSACRR